MPSHTDILSIVKGAYPSIRMEVPPYPELGENILVFTDIAQEVVLRFHNEEAVDPPFVRNLVNYIKAADFGYHGHIERLRGFEEDSRIWALPNAIMRGHKDLIKLLCDPLSPDEMGCFWPIVLASGRKEMVDIFHPYASLWKLGVDPGVEILPSDHPRLRFQGNYWGVQSLEDLARMGEVIRYAITKHLVEPPFEFQVELLAKGIANHQSPHARSLAYTQVISDTVLGATIEHALIPGTGPDCLRIPPGGGDLDLRKFRELLRNMGFDIDAILRAKLVEIQHTLTACAKAHASIVDCLEGDKNVYWDRLLEEE